MKGQFSPDLSTLVHICGFPVYGFDLPGVFLIDVNYSVDQEAQQLTSLALLFQGKTGWRVAIEHLLLPPDVNYADIDEVSYWSEASTLRLQQAAGQVGDWHLPGQWSGYDADSETPPWDLLEVQLNAKGSFSWLARRFEGMCVFFIAGVGIEHNRVLSTLTPLKTAPDVLEKLERNAVYQANDMP